MASPYFGGIDASEVDDWPYPWSRLEDLAERAALDSAELREWLKAEIDRRCTIKH